VVQMLIQALVSGKFPGWYYFASSLVSAALWPLVTWMLLAPQRRAVDRDETRPI
jgi:rod shape-determining protein MreD